jgi:diguanylate cyclase (GGDEF)-like protein
MDSSTSHVTLLEAARTVARGGELDAKLDALAEHVRGATDASAALILLLDPVGNVLLPAAQAGLDGSALDQSRAVTLDDAADVAARAVRDRRPTGGGGGAQSTSLAHHGRAAESVLALPLVISDDMGDETAEGVLLTAYEGTAPDPADADDTLLALADLCAVAIRNARLQSALHERAEWLDRLANTDSLTGLANRTTLLSMLELEIARARRQATELSLVIFDIDDYDGIVERAGASAADDVLRLVASTLADHVRLVDTIGRLGAHEFGLVAPGGGGAVVARRVQEAAGRIEAGGQPVSVSAGTAVLGASEGGSEELLAGANAALAEARRRGRGQLAGVGA